MTQSWRTKTKAHAREKRKNEKIKKLYTQRMYESYEKSGNDKEARRARSQKISEQIDFLNKNREEIFTPTHFFSF